MWTRGWRDLVWNEFLHPYDVIVVGGGITGAGILREATRAGLRALLVEQGDFASGTSSRSSKLVHGGLRYLRDAKLRLTLLSVHEREQLLREGRGLVTPLGFLLANFEEDAVPPWLFGLGLVLYDLMGLKWGHRHYSPKGLRMLCPPLTSLGLRGGFRYFDAQTDDARLVLRIIREAVADGGTALNYARAEELLHGRDGRVCGILLTDHASPAAKKSVEVQGRVVINATGAWADELRSGVGGRPRLRKLRGSHLVFPWQRLPLTRSVTFLHPVDGRPVFAIPWEGVTIFGTTDVDHGDEAEYPRVAPEEVEYLLAGLERAFAGSSLSEDDIQSCFSGVRGVIDTGKADPSKESREHVLWDERGLLTVTGGKLTTFRSMAHDALRAVRRTLPDVPAFNRRSRMLDRVDAQPASLTGIDPALLPRLLGRYGKNAADLVECAQDGELAAIHGLPALWAELRWAARSEAVVHLDDLLVRRVRLAHTLAGGGLSEMERIRSITQQELGWNDERWEEEALAYRSTWQTQFSPPSISGAARDRQ